uniref:Transcription factor TFIIICalfa n=1 Tax=Chironomus tentans TaxID=7153 RepID=Q8WQ87_CHITE|nr:transcription factor TFIIICalfa [Chironomus tentans]
MVHVPLAINEEIALEGLDGITLESFWFRMSERMQWPLPFNDRFKAELLKIILKRDYFEFYEIEAPRKTVGRLNRIDYQSHDGKATQEVHEFYHIYSYSPVDDPEIRGSCREFKTRKKLNPEVLKKLSFLEVVNLYGDKLVIVASQKLRNSVLIPSNIGRECDINNHVYCILERIGRSRYFGETTSGPYSLNDYVKDSKLLHYFRMCLLKNNLVFRQQIFQRMNNKSQITQLFHIPKYYVVVRTSDLLQVEKLVTFLFTKPNNIAPHEEVRNHLNLKSQKVLVQLMRAKSEIFEYKKFPYREIHPNATKKEYAAKNGVEKTILAIRLIDPNLNIFQLYENEEKDQTIDEEKEGFLDVSRQKLKIPLVYQVIQKITESGSRGISQSEIGKYFGLSKLNSRAVLRKVLRTEITTYMRDEGRQRITMFISKKFAGEKSQVFVNQVAKLFKKAEENVVQSSTIQMLPYESIEIAQEENLLVPIPSTVESSPTKVSIPINFLKQEASSNVIQFVQHPNASNNEQQRPMLDMEGRDDLNKFILMPNDDYSFVDNVENVQVSLRFLNNIPGLQKQSTGLQEELARNRVSEKVLFRMNVILDAIRDKAVMDPVNLLMELRKAEVNFTENICRKSLLSLCSRLAADNFIKVIEMELTSVTKTVKLLFFGEPTITFDMRCWHSIIEEQKIQHFVNMTKPPKEPEDDAVVISLPSDNSFISKTSVGYEELSAQSPIHENFPKFMKYRLFHEFLYYLIYDYPAEVEKIHVRKAVEIWRRENQRLTDYDEIAEKISICYSTDINWKMFIPPLNPQFGYENGWGFLRDIIHRIPLILYVKFTRYGNSVPEINDYLAHPIKSNYLLHFLPPKIFAKLTQGRKFIQVIVEICKRLCWMGILQFGPMRTKEIDQSFIYLNRNAMLLDTRSSEPGYMEISDKEYPKLSFTFNSSEDVVNYWSSMFEICINTRINQKSLAFGQTIILEQLHTKPDLIKTLKPQTSISASLNDNGEIPGDRKGAGGLDKGFMSHLKQIWSRSIDRKKRPISALTVERKPKPKAAKKEKAEKVKPEAKKKKSAKVKAAETQIQKSKAILQSNFKGVSSKSKIIRKVKPKKQTVKELKKKSELYDDIDKEALKLMKSLRVVWSDIEDKTLSLMKVAMKFAFPNDNQCAHYVNFGLIRDILHWRTEKALNKTSRACQRRMVYLMKNNKAFREQTFLYIEELRANREFSNKYSNFAERLKKLYNQEQIYLVVKVHLVEMIHRMHQIFLKQYLSNPLDVTCAIHEIILDIPSDYKELNMKYKIVNPNANLDDAKFHEPTNVNEIEISILASLIHGAVCSTNDKISNTFFLHETYSKFSDDNLGAAVNLLRRLTIISLNKNHRSKKLIMPRTISPFHLSNRYASQLMSIHVPVELYDEYLVAVRDISAENNLYQMKTINCGWIFMIAEFLCKNVISMKTDRCDKTTYMVDTPLRKKTNFEKISDNYLMMKNKKEQTGEEEKRIKTVRFHADNNSDEKFIYHDDPIEIFCKLDTAYLHIFCILQVIEHNENVKIDDWTFTENDKCTLKNCVIRSGNNFSIEVQKIACHGYEIIKYILNNSDEGPSKYDESLITKFNLVKFFDSIIKKYGEENVGNAKKNLGKMESNFDIRQKISTVFLLDCIQRIATELENEDGAWLSEYKKISHHKTDDEVFYDEEDVDQSKSASKTTSQLNVSKTTDSFVVNLSSLHISVNLDKDRTATIDGDPYNQKFIPFDEDFRANLLEEIKMKHVWMPEDMQKRSLQDDLDTMIISRDNRTQMELIHNFLRTKNQIGANINEILELFGNDDKEHLHKNIELLIKFKYILRTGVNEIRFIHKDYALFWLIDTFYLTAKDSDEVLEPPSKKSKLNNDQSTQGGTDNEETPMEVDESIAPKTKEQTEEFDKNLKRNPFFLLPCPWIRVGSLNRTLNRRCFDKWLGTVLNYLSINPGIILSDLCSKFNVITPVHVRNLCEILEMVGCIKLMAFPELNVSIFSDYDSHDDEAKPATYLDAFNRTYIEVNPDAFLRLTFFIGKKKYKLPFI